MELDLQRLFGLHVTWCTQLYSLAETPQLLPYPRIWASIRGHHWSAKIDRHLFILLSWLALESRRRETAAAGIIRPRNRRLWPWPPTDPFWLLLCWLSPCWLIHRRRLCRRLCSWCCSSLALLLGLLLIRWCCCCECWYCCCFLLLLVLCFSFSGAGAVAGSVAGAVIRTTASA